MTQDPATGRSGLLRQIIVDLCVLASIGVVLGLLAPLGTGFMSLPNRIAYWVVLALAGYLFYKPIGALVLRLGPRLDFPSWALWSASVLVASIPMSILVWFVNAGSGTVRVPSLEIALTHYFAVSVVGAVVTLLFNLLPATRSEDGADITTAEVVGQPAETGPVSEPPAAPQPAAPRFIDRLPPELGSDLIALEMEDHYVRAHTALGSELVLMRLRDAMAELDGIEGMQVHRSWWVARQAVSDVQRDGRNVRLVLDTGLEAPVSRANVAILKDAGWI